MKAMRNGQISVSMKIGYHEFHSFIRACHSPQRNVRKIIDKTLKNVNVSLNHLTYCGFKRKKEAQSTENGHCPLTDSRNKILNFPLLKITNVNDRYPAVRKQRLCYGCLRKRHATKKCKVNACGICG